MKDHKKIFHRKPQKEAEDHLFPDGTKDFCFGIKPVQEALEAGKTLDKVLVQKGLQGEAWQELQELLKEHEVQTQYVPIEKLNRITRKNHQGIIAFISPVGFHDLEQLLPTIYEEGRTPFFLVLDGITDVRNFGAICRTAYAAGVDAVIVPQKGGAAINADAVKTSAGALFKLKVCKAKVLPRSIEYLKASGLKIVAVTEKESKMHSDLELKGPIALVMGAEDKGISPSCLELADLQAGIPMIGDIDSLNVSVAAGVMLYEIIRQRNLTS